MARKSSTNAKNKKLLGRLLVDLEDEFFLLVDLIWMSLEFQREPFRHSVLLDVDRAVKTRIAILVFDLGNTQDHAKKSIHGDNRPNDLIRRRKAPNGGQGKVESTEGRKKDLSNILQVIVQFTSDQGRKLAFG